MDLVRLYSRGGHAMYAARLHIIVQASVLFSLFWYHSGVVSVPIR